MTAVEYLRGLGYPRVTLKTGSYGMEELAMAIKFASALSLAYMCPIGCTVAGAAKTLLFDKSFKKNRLIAVTFLPIMWQLPCYASQDSRCQVVRSDPGQYKKPCIIDNKVQIMLSLLSCPADKPVTRCHCPGGGTKA